MPSSGEHSSIVGRILLEAVGRRNSGEETAFTLERVAEEHVFGDSHVNLELFFDVDTETESDVVIGSAVSQRVGRKEVAAFLADAVLADVLVVLVAFGVEDGLLTTDADNEPIPPDVTFNTKADQASDVGTFIPVRILDIACIIDGFAGVIVERPIMRAHLVPNEVSAQPEETAIKRNVDAKANLSMLVFDARSLDQFHGEGRNEFAIESLEGEERTGLGQEGEVAIVKEVLVFGTVLDAGQAEAELEIDVAAELEVQTTISLDDRRKSVCINLVGTARRFVATILVGDIDVQAPSVAANQRATQEAVKVRHGLGSLGQLAVIANHGCRQVTGKFRNTAKETTDGKTRVGIVLVTQGDGENATKIREPRILVRTGRNILGVRTELTNQVVRIEVDVCRVVKDAHIIHDIGGVLAHGLDSGERRKGGPNTKNTEGNTNCCCRS